MAKSKTLIIILSLLIILILTGVTLWLAFSLGTDAVTYAIRDDPLFRMYVFIHEKDVLYAGMLLLFNTQTGHAALYEVPGNMGAFVEDNEKIDRLDLIFHENAPELYLEKLKSILGVRTNFYLEIASQQALSGIVDLLGGVWLSIDSLNTYVDGENIIEFLKKNKLTYESCVSALLEEFSVEESLLSHKEVQKELYQRFSTNFDFKSFQVLLKFLRELRPNAIYHRVVEGSLKEVLVEGEKKLLLFPYFDGKWVQKTVQQLETALIHEQNILPAIITMEILNGTTIPGLASKARNLYRKYGFDILSIGNAQENDVAHTVVLNHSNNVEMAQKVAEVIGAKVVKAKNSDQIDVTLILGKDFDGRYIRSE